MGFSVIIPARYESTRLPGKPLLEIAGKPLIQHTFECACRSHAGRTIIATDNSKIKKRAEAFGATVCMTGTDHQSGTERISEVVDKLAIPENEIIVNLQADEPLMPHECINQVAAELESSPDAVVSTLCEKITEPNEVFNPHVVKVVRDKDNYALYFSRATIPWHRDAFTESTDSIPDIAPYYRHIGMYAYRAGYIKQYLSSSPAEIELAESLEQLRILWHGSKIKVAEAVKLPGPGVDTEEDLQVVKRLIEQSSS